MRRQRTDPHVAQAMADLERVDPDNYTDAATFLDHLQRNPRLQPYEFWPLVADSTVIVQHVASVAVFVCCFVGISQDRISPVAVVGWGSVATVLGWILWDRWIASEDAAAARADVNEDGNATSAVSSLSGSTNHNESEHLLDGSVGGLGLMMPDPHAGVTRRRGDNGAYRSSAPLPSPTMSSHPTGAERFATYNYYAPYGGSASLFSAKNQQRIATAKSACLIYGALLGLSPILKSLTKSTSSDSIWAMSTWLMCINIFFFDYGGAVGAKYGDVCPARELIILANRRREQAPGVAVDERGLDGIDNAGLAAALHQPCLLPDALLDRGLWTVPYLPPSSTTELLARPSPADVGPGGQRRRRRRHHRLRWRLEGRCRRPRPRLCPDRLGHGGVQLVADRAAEI